MMANSSFESLKDKANIRDQLGNRPLVSPFLIFEFPESFKIDEMPTIVETRNTTNDTLWDRTPFLWDDPAFVWSDGTYSESLITKRIVLPNNVFKDFLRDTTFVDTTNTTAVVNISDNFIEW